jgi:hypothetical protein
VFFSVSLFSFSSRLFPGFPETYAHPKLKKMPKTKLKCVIPTFFSCFAKILAARTERSFLLGWSDPRLTLGTEPCAKVGSLQLGVLRAAKLIVAQYATACPLGAYSIAKVTARVTDLVICVFHAPVTFPRCK